VSWNDRNFRDAAGGDITFVQDNHSAPTAVCCAVCTTRSGSPRENSSGW
jgi:hypothetical protein